MPGALSLRFPTLESAGNITRREPPSSESFVQHWRFTRDTRDLHGSAVISRARRGRPARHRARAAGSILAARANGSRRCPYRMRDIYACKQPRWSFALWLSFLFFSYSRSLLRDARRRTRKSRCSTPRPRNFTTDTFLGARGLFVSAASKRMRFPIIYVGKRQRRRVIALDVNGRGAASDVPSNTPRPRVAAAVTITCYVQ